jgi:hypothetical protein
MRLSGDRSPYPEGTELTQPVLNQYSQTDLLNRRFRRLTWLLVAVFATILVLLFLELAGFVPQSPFQPDLRMDHNFALLPQY